MASCKLQGLCITVVRGTGTGVRVRLALNPGTATDFGQAYLTFLCLNALIWNMGLSVGLTLWGRFRVNTIECVSIYQQFLQQSSKAGARDILIYRGDN